MSKFARRVDVNQKDIVKALRDSGMYVFHLHTQGLGCPDLLCGMNGQTYLIEIKASDKAKFTDAQIKFMAEWTGGKVIRLNNHQEAIDFVKSIV